MARTYAKLKGSIWRDDDWRALPASHQRLYLLLFSQPEISNCGVLPYLPTKWYRMCADTTIADVTNLAADLQAARFVVVDEDTCELLIRTYVKHDQVEAQPKIKAAAVRQYDGIHSNRIRTVLAAEYPDTFQLGPHETADPEPYGKGIGNPTETLREGYAVPTRVRAQAVTRQPPPVNDTHQPPTAPAKNGDANAAAGDPDLEAQLRNLGWKDWQIAKGLGDPARASAIADLAVEQATANGGDVDNPGGWAWAEFAAGNTPTVPQSTLAPGAFGATRSSKPPKLPYECQHDRGDSEPCGSTFKTAERLAEHISDCHTELEQAPLPPEIAALVAKTTPPSTEPPAPPRRPAPTEPPAEETTP